MGILASCGLVALDNWKEMLQNDHDNALFLANALSEISWLKIDTTLVQTNIFRFELDK